jgi:hypothetical protein
VKRTAMHSDDAAAGAAIERMSGLPPKPAPLPRIDGSMEQSMILVTNEARDQIREATGANLVGLVKVCGPKITAEQAKAMHRAEQLRHVRSETIKRLDRDEEGRIKFHHDGLVQTSTDEARSYAWVDATEFHRASSELQGMYRTELGAIRQLRNNGGPARRDPRRPAPGVGLGGIAPIDAMALRHALKRTRWKWAQRLGWVALGGVMMGGILVLVVWLAARANAPIHTRVDRLPVPETAVVVTPRAVDAAPPAIPHRTFEQWHQAAAATAEDPFAAPDDAGVAPRVRHRHRVAP